MHRLVLIKKQFQNPVIIVLYGIIGFLDAPLITFLAIEVYVVMGGKIMEIPGKGGILLHGTRYKAEDKKEGTNYPICGLPEMQICPVMTILCQVPTSN
jgi:hypothetical protein